jgi:hypothetical protein
MFRKFIHLPVGAVRRLQPRCLMSILNHLTEIRCPICNMHLFRALDPVDGEIVFCSKCLVGGRWIEATTQRGTLTGNFVARESADDFLKKIRSPTQV